MKGLHTLCLAALLSTACAPLLAAPVYKVINADGTVSYTDNAPEKTQVAKTLEFKDLPMSVVPNAALGTTQSKQSHSTVAATATTSTRDVLYYANWCGHCKKALAYLESRHHNIAKVDIDTAYGKAAFKAVGGTSVPLIFYQGQTRAGFSEAYYDWLFKYAAQTKQQPK